MSRVAVTGIGLVTPIGAGGRDVWEGLLAGRCGFSPVESFDTSRHSAHIGAEIKGFDPGPYIQTLDPNRLGRASKLAIAAARLALADAGVDPGGEIDAERCGVAMGTTSGEPLEVERFNDLYLAGEKDEPRRRDRHSLSLPLDRLPRRPRAGFRRGEHHDPDRLRGGQLRPRLRLRRPARRAGRPHAGRRRRRLLAHHLHRLRPPGGHRPRALPAVRPQPQGHDPRRGRRGAGPRAPRPRPGARRAHLRRARRLRPVLRRPSHDGGAPGRGRRRAGDGAGARRRWPARRTGRLRQRPRHRHPHQRPAGGPRRPPRLRPRAARCRSARSNR